MLSWLDGHLRVNRFGLYNGELRRTRSRAVLARPGKHGRLSPDILPEEPPQRPRNETLIHCLHNRHFLTSYFSERVC